MATLVASFILLVLVIAGMAVGVLFGRTPIKGTCGGLNNVGAETACSLCGGNPVKCEESR